MAKLKECLTIHAIDPQLAERINKGAEQYTKAGLEKDAAILESAKDVQLEVRQGFDGVLKQLPDLPSPVEQLDTAIRQVESSNIDDIYFSMQPDIEGMPKGMDAYTVKYIDKLIKMSDGNISQNDALQIAGTIEKQYKRLETVADNPNINMLAEFNRMGLTDYTKVKPEEFANLSATERKWELAKAEVVKQLKDKKEAIRRSEMSAISRDNLQQELDQLAEDTPWRNPVERYIDLFFGDPSGRGTNFTWANRSAANTKEFTTMLARGIKEFDSWLGMRMTPEQEMNLAKELHSRGSTKDAAMRKAAEAISATFDSLRTRMNKNGADIGYIADYMPQAWNSRQVALFGLSAKEIATGFKSQEAAIATAKQRWVDYMMERLDRKHSHYIDEATGLYFTDAQMRDFLAHSFDTLSSNGANKIQGNKGKGSLAVRLSYERQLHFKDAESWLEANRAFGSQDLLTGVMSYVERGSKDLALLEMFGPNPERVHNELFAKAQSDTVGKTFFYNRKVNFAEALWMEVSGSRPTSGTGLIADAASSMRQMLVATRLGSALASQLGDLPIYHAMASKMGMDIMTVERELLGSFNPLAKGDRQAADAMEIMVTAMHDDVMARIMDTTNGKGISAKLAQFTMRAGGMTWWADRMTQGAKMGLLRTTAQMSQHKFADLPPRNKALVKRSGITESEWNNHIYENESIVADYNGRDIVLPDLVTDTLTRQKLWGMVEREATFLALRPDEKTRAVLKGTQARGSLGGEMQNSMALFRSFTAAFLQKVLPRVMANIPGESGYSRAKTAGIGLAMSMLMAAVSVQLKEIIKGREPRDMEDTRFWAQAFAQGWNFGILGDLLWGERGRGGESATELLMGAPAAMVGDVMDFTLGNIRQAAAGEETDIAAESLGMAKKYAVPNLWYTRAMADYLVWWPLQEMANPGYLSRMQNRVERENGTKFLLPPTEAAR